MCVKRGLLSQSISRCFLNTGSEHFKLRFKCLKLTYVLWFTNLRLVYTSDYGMQKIASLISSIKICWATQFFGWATQFLTKNCVATRIRVQKIASVHDTLNTLFEMHLDFTPCKFGHDVPGANVMQIRSQCRLTTLAQMDWAVSAAILGLGVIHF